FTTGAGVVFDGTIDGEAGIDTLVGGNVANAWDFTGAHAGTRNGSPFQNVEGFTGGTAADTFMLLPGASVSGTVNGGTGIDRLDFSGYGGALGRHLPCEKGSEVCRLR